jgi:hypothetical protein
MRGKPGGSRHRGHGHGSGCSPSLAFHWVNYIVVFQCCVSSGTFRRAHGVCLVILVRVTGVICGWWLMARGQVWCGGSSGVLVDWQSGWG